MAIADFQAESTIVRSSVSVESGLGKRGRAIAAPPAAAVSETMLNLQRLATPVDYRLPSAFAKRVIG